MVRPVGGERRSDNTVTSLDTECCLRAVDEHWLTRVGRLCLTKATSILYQYWLDLGLDLGAGTRTASVGPGLHRY